MKRLIVFALALILILSLAACGRLSGVSQDTGVPESDSPVESPKTKVSTSEGPTENPEPVDNGSLNDSLIGLWHSMNMVGAGFGERYAFNEDGTFIFGTSQMDESNNQLYEAGTWSIVNGELKLEIKERLVMPEGDINEIVPGDDLVILDSGVVMLIINPPEVETHSISVTGADPETGRDTITIDGVTFYDFNNQTDMFDDYYDLTNSAFLPD